MLQEGVLPDVSSDGGSFTRRLQEQALITNNEKLLEKTKESIVVALQKSEPKFSIVTDRLIKTGQRPPVCAECSSAQWRKLPIGPILRCHHKDSNHKNNSIDNLTLICPNCHEIEHVYVPSLGLGVSNLDPQLATTNPVRLDARYAISLETSLNLRLVCALLKHPRRPPLIIDQRNLLGLSDRAYRRLKERCYGNPEVKASLEEADKNRVQGVPPNGYVTKEQLLADGIPDRVPLL